MLIREVRVRHLKGLRSEPTPALISMHCAISAAAENCLAERKLRPYRLMRLDLERHTVDTIEPVFRRGVLLDIPKIAGLEVLPKDFVVTPERWRLPLPALCKRVTSR